MKILSRLAIVGLLSVIANAQTPRRHNTYTITRTKSLSAAATVMTVQQPASASNTVQAMWAKIYSDVAVTVELERNGTAATATAETEVGTNANSPTPAAVGWYDSDVGNGTTLDTFDLAAYDNLSVDLTAYKLYLTGNGTGTNFSLRSSSVTGNVRITICWREW